MSFTPTQSISAPRACAARKTFRPMRPKPLMPALRAMASILSSVDHSGREVPEPRTLMNLSGLRLGRQPVDVPVDDVDHVVAPLAVDATQVLADDDGAVAAPRA